MIIHLQDLKKTIGRKTLYQNLDLILNEGEKAALIGRNGTGKTTLLRIINNEDSDYEGDYESAKGLVTVITRQEHLIGTHLEKETTALDYVMESAPNYLKLNKIIRRCEKDNDFGEIYLDALDKFTELGYYNLEDNILRTLNSFQISEEKSLAPLISLSGGEKRFVELTRVMYSNSDLALIDEPTNHMDSVGKQRFFDWFRRFDKSILTVTHDRDVLHCVDKIFELKDQKISTYRGNYEHYLQQNAIETITMINSFETDTRRIEKIKKQMNDAKEKKLSAKSDKGRGQAKRLEERFKREYKKLKETLKKPSFWIDAETEKTLPDKLKDLYQKYKAQNIRLQEQNSRKQIQRLLIKINRLVLGYKYPLFKTLNFDIFEGDRINLQGRNGVGKTTFLNFLISTVENQTKTATCNPKLLPEVRFSSREAIQEIKKYAGEIEIKRDVKLGIYKQEVDSYYLHLTLWDAIEKVLGNNDLAINDRQVIQIMKTYLFNIELHSDTKIRDLSGGEKARFQLLKMLMRKPDVLILDEPTNHLDLPSIEEIENFIDDFQGAVIYVSHDSYFAKNLSGKIVNLSASENRNL